jgi:hypothetical protein
VHSAALSDILYLLHPTYTRASIARLDAPDARPSLALGATPYLPGFVGLNNIVGHSDYMNVVIQALAHVKPLRDYLLLGGFEDAAPLETTDTAGLRQLAHASELVKRLALLVRKLWNPRAFKAQVSPHEFAQEVTNVSGGRFRITQQADPVEFLGWLLNRLHMDLGGSRKKSSESFASPRWPPFVHNTRGEQLGRRLTTPLAPPPPRAAAAQLHSKRHHLAHLPGRHPHRVAKGLCALRHRSRRRRSRERPGCRRAQGGRPGGWRGQRKVQH